MKEKQDHKLHLPNHNPILQLFYHWDRDQAPQWRSCVGGGCACALSLETAPHLRMWLKPGHSPHQTPSSRPRAQSLVVGRGKGQAIGVKNTPSCPQYIIFLHHIHVCTWPDWEIQVGPGQIWRGCGHLVEYSIRDELRWQLPLGQKVSGDRR